MEDGVAPSTIRESGFLKELSHPNIVSLYQVVTENNCHFLIFEFVAQDMK